MTVGKPHFLTLSIISLLVVTGTPAFASSEPQASEAYVPVPFHYQINTYYCGPAALEMVFDFWGPDISQREIADVARTDESEGGTYCDELLRAGHFSNLSTSLGNEMPGSITGYTARKLGYTAFEQWSLTIDDLKALVDRDEPVIVLMWWSSMKAYGHFRVVVGYTATDIITQDPWRLAWGGEYGGANVSMSYSTFLNLWDIYSNWALLIRPFAMEVHAPDIVVCHTAFSINATVTYTCPPPFNQFDYPATSCNATLYLEEGLELALGETARKSVGNLNAGDSVDTSWIVNATQKGLYNVTALAEGIVQGSVWGDPPYDYEDRIGAADDVSLSVHHAHDLCIVDLQPLEATIVHGGELQANTTIINIGLHPETFNATAYLNTTIIHQQTISLTSGSATTLTFHWNTTSISPGNYSFTLHASPVTGETDISDNTYEFGTITIVPQIHNLAITNIALSKTSVGQGYDVEIFVTVKNLGNMLETFSLTTHVNMTPVVNRNISLSAGNTLTLNLTWHTSSFIKGNYTIWADILPLPSETDTTDNILFATQEVCLTIPGDVDADLDVDIYDIVQICGVYGVALPDPRYDPNCDIDGDGDIDIYDVVIACGHYGKSL